MESFRAVLGGIDLGALNAYIALMAVVINFTFALLAMARTSRETVYVTFALICLGVAWWNFWDFMVYATGSPIWNPVGVRAGTPWKNLVPIGSGLAAASLFHFSNALLDRDRRNLGMIVLAYALAVPIAVLPLAAPYSSLVEAYWTGPWWNLTFFLALFPFMAASVFLVAAAYVRTSDAPERGWLSFILAAMVIQILTGITDLFHKLVLVLPPLGHLGSAVGPMVLGTGVYRYRRAFDVLAQTRSRLQTISEAAAEIAHEVRNPLTALRGLSALLESDGMARPARVREYREIMIEEIDRIEHILETLQDLTRPLTLQIEEVDVNEVLRRTVRLEGSGNPGLQVSLSLQEGLTPLEADPSLLKQAFLNLIRNAADACSGKGSLLIQTVEAKDRLTLTFLDDGPGVSEEIRGRLFDPFFTTKETGFGLGLAVVGKVIQAHRGTVTIENDPEGGAKVLIELPLRHRR